MSVGNLFMFDAHSVSERLTTQAGSFSIDTCAVAVPTSLGGWEGAMNF